MENMTNINSTNTNEASPPQVFNNAEFGNVRVIVIDGEPWFVGKDVAVILGYSNTRDALAKRVDKEDKLDGVAIYDSLGREQKPVFINESGLYSLILSSKLPTAKKFKHWVTSEVLPTIAKTGGYIHNVEKMAQTYAPSGSAEQLKMMKEMFRSMKEIQQEVEQMKRWHGAYKRPQEGSLPLAQKTKIRRAIVTLIRACADFSELEGDAQLAWSEFYNRVNAECDINIWERRKAFAGGTARPVLDFLGDDEYYIALDIAGAMCEEVGLNPGAVLSRALGINGEIPV